jgi:hypothetical protein
MTTVTTSKQPYKPTLKLSAELRERMQEAYEAYEAMADNDGDMLFVNGLSILLELHDQVHNVKR